MQIQAYANNVIAVLLSDGWHGIDKGTFNVGKTDQLWKQPFVLGDGQLEHIDVFGASWIENGHLYIAQLSAVLALKHAKVEAEGEMP